MADFVADDAAEFVVGHYVHQGGEYAHAAVGTGESVDVDNVIDLEVERQTVDFGQTFGEFVQAYGVGVIVGKHGVVFVHPVDIFFHVVSHLLVGQGYCFGCLCSGVDGFG